MVWISPKTLQTIRGWSEEHCRRVMRTYRKKNGLPKRDLTIEETADLLGMHPDQVLKAIQLKK